MANPSNWQEVDYIWLYEKNDENFHTCQRFEKGARATKFGYWNETDENVLILREIWNWLTDTKLNSEKRPIKIFTYA